MTASHNNQSPTPAVLIELKRLIAASSDGALEPAERDRLEQILSASRAARSMYVGYMQLDAGLDWKIRGRDSLRGLMALSREEVLAQQSAEHTPQIAAPGGYRRTSRLFSSLAAIAASLLLAIGWSVWTSERGRAPEGIAAVDQTLGGEAAGSLAGLGGAVGTVVPLSDDCRWFVENRTTTNGALHAGDVVRLSQGRARLEFTSGAAVTMKSPAALEVISPMRTRAVLGTLTAHVEQGAEGFTVETPRTTVVDLGTDFGIEVTDHGSTDVVVFTGAVDIHSDGVDGLKSRQRLSAGEGVRVSGEGTAGRIVSIIDSQFAIADGAGGHRHRTPVISEVRDNIRRGESWHYYEIVHGGMREDAKAFVDRKDHEWNGVDASGLPSYLLGADYVKTFNDDKLNKEVEIRVTLDRPAILYVLHDNRTPVPDWLRDGFFDTGDDIGIDGGGYTRLEVLKTTAIGPGNSIDDTLSIWRRDVPKAGTVTLGAIQIGGEKHNMYGVAAVPMRIHAARDDVPGFAAHPCSKSKRIMPGPDGEFSIDGAIERPSDADVFRFDWKGGVVDVACHTSGYTTLDPVLSIYDANQAIVGYARSDRSRDSQSAVTMNLPRGVYYAMITGSDDVGEVGVYHLQIMPGSVALPQPPPPSPSLVLDATPSETGVMLSWSELPLAESYTVERSRDAVNFDPIATTPATSAVDSALDPGETYFYRLRADTASDQLASAVLAVRTRPAAAEGLRALGRTSQLILLEWTDVSGEAAYRIERSSDAERFETIAMVAQNSCGYHDRDIEPGRRYFYRVATLDALGTCSISDPVQGLSGVGKLSATPLAGDRVALSWEADYTHGRLFLERAVGRCDRFIPIAKVDAQSREFVDMEAIGGTKLRYRVRAAEDINDLSEVKSDDIDTIRIPDKVHIDHFALQFTGKLRIEKPGSYTFYLNSDDGSRLILNGSTLIDNDGHHQAQVMWAPVTLAAGLHDLEIQYFEHHGQCALDVSWSGPGFPKTEIPSTVLSSLRYRYYQGFWWYLPFNKTSAISDIVAVETPITLTAPAIEHE